MAALDDLNAAIDALTATVSAEIATRANAVDPAAVEAAAAKLNALNEQLKPPVAPAG